MQTSGPGRLADIPRVALGHWPTPIDALRNLSADVGNVMLYVKRDDCTGLAFGGNKVRQLEFYLGQALAESADTVLITGAVQSNFVRLTAAAACKLGMQCHVQLEERVPKIDALYRSNGNVLLDRLFGAAISSYPAGEDEAGADRRVHEIADELARAGRQPYVIPLAPGHPPLGALGYVVAAGELLEQVAQENLHIDEIVVASGSGHTHAGLVVGLRALGSRVAVIGVCVRRDAASQRMRIRARCQELAELLGIDPVVDDDDILLLDEFLGPGYGQLNRPTLEAMRSAAQREGLVVDPVYTARAMAGLLQRARMGRPGRSLLVFHTGGTPAVFAYEPALTEYLSDAR